MKDDEVHLTSSGMEAIAVLEKIAHLYGRNKELEVRIRKLVKERDEAYRQLHVIMRRISDLDPEDESQAMLNPRAEIVDVVVEWIEKQVRRRREKEE